MYLTASRRLLDVLPTFPARTPTPGRAALSGRVVFDHWRMAPGDGLERQLRLMDACGMKRLLVLLHTWMRYGYDRKQPQFSPANPDRWTDKQFKSAIAACRQIDYRVAVHENYNHMDWDSPYHDRQFMSKLANGRVSTYIPTTDQAERGAYGAMPILSRALCADAGRRMVDQTIIDLHDLWK